MNLSKGKRAIVMIVSYFLIQLIVSPILFQTLNLSLNTTTIATSVILLAIALLLYGSQLKADYQRFKEQFEGWGKFSLKAISYYLLLYVLRVVVLMVLMNFMDVENLLQNQQSLNDMSATLSFPTMFFMVSIYAPIVEELVFREAFIGWVDKNNHNRVMLMGALSVIIFTLLHAFELADFLLYLPLAVVLVRYYFDYDRNVVASIFFHFINNTIAVILMYVLL